mgnify:CR=1 FL=1
MCILFLSVKRHAKYPLIICANRDEFHQRPTEKMHIWPENNILAGKDIEAGGSWLGLSSDGKFSAVTNFRLATAIAPHKKSRGHLVVGALEQLPDSEALIESSISYNGYNLVFGELDALKCFDSINQKTHDIEQGFHSISNGALDDVWPKMAHGQHLLEQLISTTVDIQVEQLFALMENQQKADESELPNTGLEPHWEKLLSSIFIVSPDYGTRATSILMVDQQGNVEVYDRGYDAQGKVTYAQAFALNASTKRFEQTR